MRLHLLLQEVLYQPLTYLQLCLTWSRLGLDRIMCFTQFYLVKLKSSFFLSLSSFVLAAVFNKAAASAPARVTFSCLHFSSRSAVPIPSTTKTNLTRLTPRSILDEFYTNSIHPWLICTRSGFDTSSRGRFASSFLPWLPQLINPHKRKNLLRPDSMEI